MNDKPAPSLTHREDLLAAALSVASAMHQLSDVWDSHFDGDAYTPETGYPFEASLEDVVANVDAWIDVLRADKDVALARHDLDRALAAQTNARQHLAYRTLDPFVITADRGDESTSLPRGYDPREDGPPTRFG